MAPSDLSPRVRGACPGVHAPFAGVDGALIRVRLPGGRLASDQLRVCAGLGALEITSRANLQVRGIPDERWASAADALVGAGLAPPDPAADQGRNLTASPTAGIDPGELVDTRPLGTEIVALLAGRAGSLAPKFGVVLDGGGEVGVRGLPADLCIGAVALADGSVGYEVRLGEALPALDGGPLPGEAVVVPPEAATVAVAAALGLCRAGERGAEARARHGRTMLHRHLAARAGGRVAELPRRIGRPSINGPGLLAGPHPSRTSGMSWCGATPLLGRLDQAAATGLADAAQKYGTGEVRLTPWRSVLLPGVPDAVAGEACAALARCGFSVDPADPVHRVIACAGQAGCPQGLTDTVADATRLVTALRVAPGRTLPVRIHFSGCPKLCADRRPDGLTLVGGPRPGRYDLYRAGALAEAGLDPDAALGALTTHGRDGA
ncbi:MAG: precorrin-3B synthase, partial [Acidimicrobiia bacterium]